MDEKPRPSAGSDEQPTQVAPDDVGAARRDVPSDIGPYHLIRPLGEGGMGEVWEARQTDPIERTVAVKLLKLGMDTRQFVSRFDSERQALALMEHEAIARVFDGGATTAGRPYFVMEYVEGVPISRYCDQRRLPLPARLELFIAVCEGVQHAHRRGIIHRDLKPSNVLVAEVDGRAVPKIIDFGVAKATTESFIEDSVQTRPGGWIGTPAYMSPEQAEITGDIDTRTDVYSLGVMLYELLTGHRPFDGRTLDTAGFDEMRRVIREVDPPRPSTHAGGRAFRGDLDWITMKALEKERERRYGSPAELAADVRRHLEDRPVSAGPPSRLYRLGKFWRRHRVGVAMAAAVALSLVAAVVGIGIGLQRARRAEALAVAEAERASREARTAERALDFLVETFRESAPERAQDVEVSAREVLVRAADRVDVVLGSQDVGAARLRSSLALVFESYGSYERAEALYLDALAVLRDELGERDELTDETLTSLAGLYWRQGRYDEAEPLYREVLGRRTSSHGPDHMRTLLVVNNLANVHLVRGELEPARELYQRVLEGTEGSDSGADLALAARNNLASVLEEVDDPQAAHEQYVEVLAARRRRDGENHPLTLGAAANLAGFLTRTGRVEEASPLARDTLERRQRVLGDEHPDTLTSFSNLADLHARRGEHAEAERLRRQVLEARSRVLGADHYLTHYTAVEVALGLLSQGRPQAARSHAERAAEGMARTLGEGHELAVYARGVLAATYASSGDDAAASALLADLPAAWWGLVSGSEGDPQVQLAVIGLARHAARTGDHPVALDLLEEAVDGGFRDGSALLHADFRPLSDEPRLEALTRRLASETAGSTP